MSLLVLFPSQPPETIEKDGADASTSPVTYVSTDGGSRYQYGHYEPETQQPSGAEYSDGKE